MSCTAFEDLESLLQSSKPEQGLAERRQIGGLRILPDRARSPLDHMIKLRCVEVNQRHQVQEFRLFGVACERLQTAALGFEKPPGAHFAEHSIDPGDFAIHSGAPVGFPGWSKLMLVHLLPVGDSP